MRLFFGIIIGILLTVGGAYVADSMTPIPPDSTVARVHMVNWDVVGTRFNNLGASVRGLWNKLTGAAPSPDAGTTPTSTEKPADKPAEKPAN